MRIRVAQSEDLGAIVGIYNEAIATRRAVGDLTPVSVADRLPWFEEHRAGSHPLFVAEVGGKVAGWCSLSAYRPGRMALRHTAEISYFVAEAFQRRGLATALIRHAIESCESLQIRNLFGIVMERNEASRKLMVKLGFEQWGLLPRVADFNGEECGHLYFGRRVG